MMTDGEKFAKVLLELFEEIAKREKSKCVEARDYGTAFALAVVEGLVKEAAIDLP